MTFKLGNLGISTFAGENTSDDFLLNGKNTNSNSGQDKFTVPPKVSVQARSDEDPIELHKRLLLEAASRAGLDDTTEQADFVRTHADGKISFTENDPSPKDSAQVKKGEIKSGSVNYTLGDKELADLKLLQSVYAATNGNKLHKGRSYQSTGNAATNSRQTTEAFEKRKLEQLWRDAQLPTNSVFGTPSKLRDLKHVSLTVPDAKPVDADRALRLYIRDRYGDRLNSDSRDVLFDLAKQRGIRIENLTLENGQADFDISVESLLKLQHTYIGVQEKVNAELKIAQSVVDNLPHNRFAKGVFEGAWEDLKANWKMVSDPVGTIKGLYDGAATLAKAGVMLAQMKPQDRQALFLQLAAAGIKGLAEMPVADAAEALGKLVGAGAVELALGKGVGVALKALRGTQFGAALIADATKIAGELKQSIGKIPIPTGKVLIPVTDGFSLAMPKAETVKLSDFILQMKSSSEKLGMLEGGTAASKQAIKETAETGLTKVAQSGVKHLKGELPKEVLAKIKERLVTLNVARTELMARIDVLINSTSTSSNTKGVLETLKNQLKNGTKQDDLIGALRDLNGKVVRRSGDGKAFQHSEEIQRTINSIKKSEKHLKEDLVHYAGGSSEFVEISKELDAMKEMKRLINEFLEIK